MPDITIRPVDTTTEKKIITALIVSTKFCSQIVPVIRMEYFEVGFIKTIVRWILVYYKKYKKAPTIHIQDLFEQNKKKLKPDVADLVENFLLKLSENYVLEGSEDNEAFNTDYYVDIAFDHFRERSLQLHTQVVQSLLEEGKREEAGKEVEKFRQLQKEIYPYETLSADVVERVLLRKEQTAMLTFPGKLGNLIGGLERGWLVSYLGPMKRGKSFMLLETSYQAVISRLKCLFISLEMSTDEVWERFLKRITSCGDEGNKVWYPVFDCLRNQDGSCKLSQRVNKEKLLDKGLFKPDVDKVPNYKPCAICRATYSGGKKHTYIPETWYEGISRDKLDYALALKVIGGITRMYGMNKIFRVLTFPTYTMNLSKLENYLTQWEDSDGWIPDVLVIDYADIIAPEDTSEAGRDRIDHTWKELKRLASYRKCLVVTATQANRSSIEKFMVKQTHTSEDIRKLAHVDVMLSLNQTSEEKRVGVMRIGAVVHRHKRFLETEGVTILQALDVGQPHLDSEYGVIEGLLEKKSKKE